MLPQNTLPPSLSDFTPLAPEVTPPPRPPLIVQEHRDKASQPTVSRCTDGCINRSRFALVKTMIKSSITMLPIRSKEKNHHDFNYARKEDNVSIWWQWKQMTRKRAFSHAFGSFPVFTLSSHWPMMVLSFVIIGWSDYIGFEFLTVNWKLHKCNTKFPSLAYRNCFILLR